MARQTPIISISVNGGPANISNDDVALGSTVTLINIDRTNVDRYAWEIISKPPGSAAVLSFITWDRSVDGGELPNPITTSFVADVRGTYIIGLILNRNIRGRIGAAVRSAYLNMRVPAVGEINEFSGWGAAICANVLSLEDGYESLAVGGGGGELSGDLSGTLPDPTVTGIRGRAITEDVPEASDVLTWNGESWAPAAGGVGELSGDLSGTLPDPTVTGIQGRTITEDVPEASDVLTWNGAAWAPAAQTGGITFTDIDGYALKIDLDSYTTLANFNDHSARHESGGGDPIKLDDLAAPDNNTDLNATTSAHGLLPKLDNVSTHYLNGQGSWTVPAGGDGLDRMLVFSDDTEFTETGSSLVTKKTFRIVKDSEYPPTSWRIVVSLYVEGAESIAECQVNIGGDTLDTLITSTSGVEEVLYGDISTITALDTTLLTANIQLRAQGGIGTAHIKYTDIYAVFGVSPVE